MDLKDLKVERIALLLLVSFIVILFIDYSFNLTEIIKVKLQIDLKDLHKLRFLVLISIVPIIQFISKTEFDRTPDILANSLIPFLTFLIGFYLIKIGFFNTINGIVIVMIIQLCSALTYLITISIYFSMLIKWFNGINKKLIDKNNTKLKESTVEFITENIKASQTINNIILEKFKTE